MYNKENWRTQMDGIAYCYMVLNEFKTEGSRQKFFGDLFACTTALCTSLVPVLIGLQGSLGETPEQKKSIDSTIKYITISMGIAGTIVMVLERIYSFRKRGCCAPVGSMARWAKTFSIRLCGSMPPTPQRAPGC